MSVPQLAVNTILALVPRSMGERGRCEVSRDGVCSVRFYVHSPYALYPPYRPGKLDDHRYVAEPKFDRSGHRSTWRAGAPLPPTAGAT
jgi:hypothetical protein